MPKTEQKQQCRQQVQQFNQAHLLTQCQQDNAAFMQYANVPHFLSNEMDVAEVQQALAKLPSRKSETILSVAILTGEGFFLSRLPELAQHVDVLLLADIHPVVHAHNQHMLHCMLAAEDIKAFWRAYSDANKNPVIKAKFPSNQIKRVDKDGDIHEAAQFATIGKADIMALVDASRRHILPKLHFLASEQRYQACRDALKSVTVLPLHLDWTNSDAAKDLRNQLADIPVEFTFLHISNVQDYDANYPARELLQQDTPIAYRYRVLAALNQLCPDPTKPLINYSACHKKTHNTYLHSYLVQGIAPCRRAYEVREAEMNAKLQDKLAESKAKEVIHDLSAAEINALMQSLARQPT